MKAKPERKANALHLSYLNTSLYDKQKELQGKLTTIVESCSSQNKSNALFLGFLGAKHHNGDKQFCLFSVFSISHFCERCGHLPILYYGCTTLQATKE